MNSYKKYIVLTITVLLCGLLIATGTFAFFSCRSATNNTITFNGSKELAEYINYDDGESKFNGNFKVGSTYTDGIYTTISISKTSDAASIPLYATINLSVKEIGTNMSSSTALKWVLTEGNNTNPGNIINKGNNAKIIVTMLIY